jgi:soluble lytic murein transglycosylase-like protein
LIARMLKVFLLAVLIWLASVPRASAQSLVSDRYDDVFRKYTKRFFGPAYDWRIFKAQSMTESNLNPDAVSHVGARGLMQLMPSTYDEIRTRNPHFGQINDPEWNIAAGIYYNRLLYRQWSPKIADTDLKPFMFGSYNAGSGTILRAQKVAIGKSLDEHLWFNIRSVAPEVRGWRHRETLDYVERIEFSFRRMDDRGRVVKK